MLGDLGRQRLVLHAGRLGRRVADQGAGHRDEQRGIWKCDVGSDCSRADPRSVNTVLPSISGSPVEGQSLKASNGTWSGSPTSFSYQWQDCNSSGSACSAISGATNATYTLAGEDLGHTIRVQVSATNAGGSSAAVSSQTAVVLVPAPLNSVLPAVSGSAVEGQSLKAANGTWSGSPTSYAYQWQDCDSSGSACSAISAPAPRPTR